MGYCVVFFPLETIQLLGYPHFRKSPIQNIIKSYNAVTVPKSRPKDTFSILPTSGCLVVSRLRLKLLTVQTPAKSSEVPGWPWHLAKSPILSDWWFQPIWKDIGPWGLASHFYEKNGTARMLLNTHHHHGHHFQVSRKMGTDNATMKPVL